MTEWKGDSWEGLENQSYIDAKDVEPWTDFTCQKVSHKSKVSGWNLFFLRVTKTVPRL